MKKILILLALSFVFGRNAYAGRSVTSFPTITPATDDYFILSDTSSAGAFGRTTFADTKTALGVPATAASLPFAPNGSISSTDVQAAIQEVRDEAGGGGYANLTQYVTQTPWRLFYSNASGVVTELALGAAGTYLAGNGTTSAPVWSTPAGAGDMTLAGVQSVAGLKTFDKDKLALKGTSTGVTTISTANVSGTSYTATLPAATGTIAYISDLPTLASLQVDDLNTLSGVAAGAVNLGTFTGITIADNSTNKSALQSLETAVELRAPIASPTFTGTVTAPSFSSNAADGVRYVEALNTVALASAPTLGRLAWLNDRWWLANGTGWAANFILGSNLLGSNVFAFLATPTGANLLAAVPDITLPHSTNPTVDAAGEVAVDTSTGPGQGIRAYGAIGFTVPAYQSKCITIPAATSSSDLMVASFPYAITIRAAHLTQIGATNVVGHFDICNSAGASCATIDSTADITATTTASDDGTLSNPSAAASSVIAWHTTSVSGTNTQIMACFDYTVDMVN